MLTKTLANPGLIHSAGENARRTVYVSWESVVDRVAVEYSRIIVQYKEKKAARGRRPRYYSVPVAFAAELLNKQAVRIRFTTRTWTARPGSARCLPKSVRCSLRTRGCSR